MAELKQEMDKERRALLKRFEDCDRLETLARLGDYVDVAPWVRLWAKRMFSREVVLKARKGATV